jgi:hypothetical protein
MNNYPIKKKTLYFLNNNKHEIYDFFTPHKQMINELLCIETKEYSISCSKIKQKLNYYILLEEMNHIEPLYLKPVLYVPRI